MLEFLAAITWRPGIGDQNPLAWCVTVSYFVASVLCFAVARRPCGVDSGESGWLSRFWFVLTATMLLLGFNKQLDLQTLLTQIGREVARTGDWYDHRRAVQTVFILCWVIVAAAAASVGLRMIWGQRLPAYLAYVGAVFLVTFVVIRAASFHHIDVVLYHLPGIGNWLNTGLEFSGVLLVIVGGSLALLKPRTAA